MNKTLVEVSAVLFLDFDGVLHPKGGVTASNRFSRLPLLESLLLEPELGRVAIVIASTWREAYSLTKLRSFFPPTLRARVIDCTPQLDDLDSDYLRYREIRSWLNQHPETEAWAALDDAADEFPPEKQDRAVFTDPRIGLSEEGVVALRQLLAN